MMNGLVTPSPLTENSPSVQAHLSMVQSIIQRMASNSSASKAWCISVVAAILVLVADKGRPQYAFIAVLPTVLFLALDAYYLALEKQFRKSYDQFVTKVHSGALVPADLFSISPGRVSSRVQLEALGSFSVWGFYGTVLVLIELARALVLA